MTMPRAGEPGERKKRYKTDLRVMNDMCGIPNDTPQPDKSHGSVFVTSDKTPWGSTPRCVLLKQLKQIYDERN